MNAKKDSGSPRIPKGPRDPFLESLGRLGCAEFRMLRKVPRENRTLTIQHAQYCTIMVCTATSYFLGGITKGPFQKP